MGKNRKENEAVVNRFLLSTVYITLFELILFFMYKLETGDFGLAIFSNNGIKKLHMFVVIFGLGMAVYFFVRRFILKKGTIYHFVIFFVLGLSGLFLEFAWVLPITSYFAARTIRRYTLLALLYLVFYVYEIVVYFLRVNK